MQIKDEFNVGDLVWIKYPANQPAFKATIVNKDKSRFANSGFIYKVELQDGTITTFNQQWLYRNNPDPNPPKQTINTNNQGGGARKRKNKKSRRKTSRKNRKTTRKTIRKH